MQVGVIMQTGGKKVSLNPIGKSEGRKRTSVCGQFAFRVIGHFTAVKLTRTA